MDLGTPTNATLGATTTHTYTITDDDAAPTVAFAVASSSGGESTTSVNLTVNLSAASGKAVSVPFSVNVSSTATGGGTDYTIAASPLTFNAGEITKNISITINSDTTDENDETIVVDLGTPTNATLGATTTHTYTITDDDAAPTVAFAVASSSGGESTTSVNLTVNLSAASGKAVSVPFSVNVSSTATGGGTDYTIAASPLTFNAGEITKNISITINSDTTDENDETIVVDLGTPTNATLGATTTHTYTITDDDAAPTVAFSTSSSSGNETVTPANIAVTLSSASGLTVSVNYSVTGGTATSGTDYSLSAGTLTFNPSETTKNISITIIDDGVVETNETIIVGLNTPSNATLGAITSHTYTIMDNDGDTTPPDFSGTFSGADAGSGETVNLTWTQATDTQTSQASIIYEICQSSISGGCSTFTTSYSTTGSGSYSVAGLTNGAKYFFKIRAKDQGNNTTVNPTEVTAIPYNRTLSVLGYNMIAVPGELGSGQPTSIFGDDLSYVRVMGWNGSYTLPSLVEEGKGYWILNNTSDPAIKIDIDSSAGDCGSYLSPCYTAQSSSVNVNFAGLKGWQLIGNPCLTNISGSNITVTISGNAAACGGDTSCTFNEAVTGNFVRNTIYHWNGNNYTTDAPQLTVGEYTDPWFGYWLYVYNTTPYAFSITITCGTQ